MTRRVTAKDGADAVTMLDAEHAKNLRSGSAAKARSLIRSGSLAVTEKAPRKRTPRLHVDPATGARVLAPKARAMQAHEVKQKVPKESKAALLRVLLDQGRSVREVADALKDRGVTWSYAWDVAAAYEKKTGKVFIASHSKDGAK